MPRAVHGLAWPESPGFGLAWGGFGFLKPQCNALAGVKARRWWVGDFES